MEKEVKFDYDTDGDSLYIYKKDAKIKYSVELGDESVVDINYNGNVAGIEIFNASKKFGVTKNTLNGIKKVSLSVRLENNIFVIFIHVYLKAGNPLHTIILPKSVAVASK